MPQAAELRTSISEAFTRLGFRWAAAAVAKLPHLPVTR
jgi:hypothetical protein